jgi:hypothetical protein
MRAGRSGERPLTVPLTAESHGLRGEAWKCVKQVAHLRADPVLSRLLAISQVASQPTLTQEGKLKLAIADLFI